MTPRNMPTIMMCCGLCIIYVVMHGFPYKLLPCFLPLHFCVAFSMSHISTSAVLCHIFMSRIFISRIFSAPRSTQPLGQLSLASLWGSLNRVPALIGWGNGGNVTSAGWQVILCDPMWHVSSRSGVVLVAQTAIRFLTLPYIRCTAKSYAVGPVL